MPNKDKTGPQGFGSKTGRQMGNCESTEPVVGRRFGSCGRGMRKGFGRLMGRCNSCPPKFLAGFSKEEEKKILEEDLVQIESDKQEIEKRLKELS